MSESSPTESWAPWRRRAHEIIFEADTSAGKVFDIVLLVLILLSVVTVILETVEELDKRYHQAFFVAEWIFTALFTVEYVLRLLCVRRPHRYALSFFGVVDLLAILPTYLSLLLPGAQSLVVIRALRLLRVFRVFKLARMLSEASALREALWASRAKITVFLTTVLIVITIMAAAMHLVEGPEHGFTSIPVAMYWAVVTMTTVGYGDIAPQTALGKLLAAGMMVLGYALIIVPGGIISVQWMQSSRTRLSTQVCPDCSREGHEPDAVHCKYCGGKL